MITVDDLCHSLPSIERETARILVQVLAAIEDLAQPRALFVHGSHTRSTQIVDSDFDLIVVMDTRERVHLVVQDLPAQVGRIAPILASAYTEKFPWFGRLWTFYFDRDPLLALDLGFIDAEGLCDFFVEPDAVILHDAHGAVATRLQQCYQERLAARANCHAEAEFEVFHTVIKLERALRRGHLWNAFEYVNILRRTLFRVLRAPFDSPRYVHVGRPERDIETKVPWVALEDWTDTIPAYGAEAIVEAAMVIVKRIRAALGPTYPLARSGLLDLAIPRLSRLRTPSVL